jgi:hypothetical protein
MCLLHALGSIVAMMCVVKAGLSASAMFRRWRQLVGSKPTPRAY